MSPAKNPPLTKCGLLLSAFPDQVNAADDAIPTSKVSNSIMNRITMLLMAAVAVIAGCSRHGIKGDGVIKTAERPISDFSALVVTGGYQIKWSTGKPALTISTDQNLLPLIKTIVSGNTLEIDSEENLVPTKGITRTLAVREAFGLDHEHQNRWNQRWGALKNADCFHQLFRIKSMKPTTFVERFANNRVGVATKTCEFFSTAR